MMKINFEKLFGCCDSTIGGLVIGMLGILASGTFFVLFYLFLINYNEFEEDPDVSETFLFSKPTFAVTVFIALMASILCFVFSILLMRGILIKQSNLLLPWLYFDGFLIFVIFLSNHGLALSIENVLITVASTTFQAYIWCCVYYLYKRMRSEECCVGYEYLDDISL